MPGDSPTLEGTLDDVPLGSLLRLLVGQERTGSIRLEGNTPAIVRIHSGKVDYATGSDLSPLRRTLDDVLTDEQWNDLTDNATTPQQAIEAVIRAPGLDDDRARTALREQSVMTLFEFAVPGDERFSFFEDASESVGLGPGFEVEEMLLQVDRRVDAWREIAGTVPSTAAIFQLSPGLPEGIAEVRLGAADWEILAVADGHRTVGQMVDTLEADAFSLCSAIHRLCEANLLRPIDDTNTQAPS